MISIVAGIMAEFAETGAMNIHLQVLTVLATEDGIRTQERPTVVYPRLNAEVSQFPKYATALCLIRRFSLFAIGQGGSLSAFYQSFGQVDQTLVQVEVENYGNLPFCTNVNQPSDGQFQTGVMPPYRRDMESAESNTTAASVGRYEYRTAGNRTLLSLSGPHAIGDVVFLPNLDWATHPLAAAVLAKRQDTPNDDCTGTAAQLEAVRAVPIEELGTTDVIVEAL